MKKCVDLLNTKEYSLLIDTTFKNNDLPNVNPKYVVQKIYKPTPPPPPPRVFNLVLPPTRWNFLSRGACLTPSPQPPGISVIFNFVGYPLERIFVSKMLLHYVIMRKIIFFFSDKLSKNLFIHVSTVSNKLKDVIS